MNNSLRDEVVLSGDECPGVRGNTRKPKFGEWMRGVWASVDNPIRDGMYVRTVRRTGRLNPGTWHELTDGKGKFWEFEAKHTVFIDRHPTADGVVVPRELFDAMRDDQTKYLGLKRLRGLWDGNDALMSRIDQADAILPEGKA